MIVVDIETSGQYLEKHGIWQIGALDFYNPANTFLEEARIDDEDEVEDGATRVHGKDEAYLRDTNKQSQKQLVMNFFDWCRSVKIKNALCENPQFDLGFLNLKARKYSLSVPYHHRAFDLHSTAQTRYAGLNNMLFVKDGHSDLGLRNILYFCGLPDPRISLEAERVIEGTPHNALEDAQLEAECYARLVFGKSLLPRYAKYPLPEVLTK